VTVEVDGWLQRLNANSLLALRVDYRVNGRYAKAVVFHGRYGGIDLFDRRGRSMIPWGLAPTAEIAAVPDLARFQVALKEHAPAGWTGTAHLAFLMQNAGAGTRAKFTVRAGARSTN
jgi:hypothetical protein